ncbi:hypothetical protein [Pseudomonas saliphila]|uniref:hypothetical protein n=1 Tax=Pseudomonas saliphila TaxID=2586906 RepID=UPI001238791F|nr:hypothetical protein [Pseudomonas saliphila]
MKQEQPENQPNFTTHNETDTAKRAIASDTWVFWALLVRWGLFGMAILYWLGAVGFSPLDFIEWVGSLLLDSQEISFDDMPRFLVSPLLFIRELVAGASWALLTLPWLSFVRYRVGIIEAGSKDSYRQRLRDEANRASTPSPAGGLAGMSIVKGGFLSSSETLVETSEGFFRVSGLLATVKKGDPVFTLGSQLLIGAGAGEKRYTIIS